MLGPHALFDPAMLDTPKLDDAFRAQADEREWKVTVKRRGAISTITYPFNPLDAVGWKGNLSVVSSTGATSARHEPSLSCSADRFIRPSWPIGSWSAPSCRGPIESDPGALKVPFFHSNDDFDEVIFYHQGEFFSRDNIHPGMVTFHPYGFTHGPHPKAFAAGAKAAKTMTDEVAVMIDARDPLEMSACAPKRSKTRATPTAGRPK